MLALFNAIPVAARPYNYLKLQNVALIILRSFDAFAATKGEFKIGERQPALADA